MHPAVPSLLVLAVAVLELTACLREDTATPEQQRRHHAAGRRIDNGAAGPPARTRRVAVYDGGPHGGFLADDDKDDVLLAALRRAQGALGLGRPVRPPMHKVSLTQIGYIQFLRYTVDVPELRELSFCVWLKSKNLTHNHPVLSYSKNEKERLVRAWVSPAAGRLPPRLHLAVMERPVFVEPLPEAAHRRWLHLCASWDGGTGQYRLYVDGRPRRAGERPEVAGLVVPGGGDIVVGQEYTDFDKGLDDGIEGEVFGFHLFRTATPPVHGLGGRPADSEHDFDEDLQWQLLRARRRGGSYADDTPPPASGPWPRRRSGDVGVVDAALAAGGARPKRQHGPRSVPPRVQRLYARCSERLAPEDRADAIVAWPTTPVRVFGGAIIFNVNPGCGDF
ncbi:hypothetical protein ONE63_001740 [Megalurothrips usitatus]|uniref:Pentraxin (PTX) domain-containing protein n=1 Tax=Megalurothrips usitatus TaxID=439358 RepID=A0AAV7XG45_9NEOP|nr:hypothetical protein ONE63_001740 [Megalurothrips usitatus]